jgi:putative ABC transport system permease protein
MSSRALLERAVSPRFREAFRMAIEVLRAHRLRSILVIVGVCVGVTTLMGMVTVLQGVGRQIEANVRSSDESLVTVSKFDFLGSGYDPIESRKTPNLTAEDADAIEELCPSVRVAEFYIDATSSREIHYGKEKTRPTPIAGAARNFPYVYNIPLREGRYFTDADISHARKVVVLGSSTANVLFGEGTAASRFVRLGQEPFEVVGVFAERSSLFSQEMANAFAVVPWSTLERMQGVSDFSYIYAAAREGYTLEDVVEDARAVLRTRHRLSAADPDDFWLITSDRIEKFVGRITGTIALVLVVLSSIGLLVGGIGVTNIMLISVTERTSELGLRKALGARSRDLLAQILVESSILTGLGGVIGLALSAIVALVVSRLLDVPFAMSAGYTILAVSFSVGVGIVFGLYPAARAARLSPIDAIRRE